MSFAQSTRQLESLSRMPPLFASVLPDALTVPDIAVGYRKTPNRDKAIADVLASLARLGHVATRDGKSFAIRRAA